MKRYLILCLILSIAILTGCDSVKLSVNGPTENQVSYLDEKYEHKTLKIVDGAESGSLVLAGAENSFIYALDANKVDILIDGKTVGDIGDLVLKDREMLSDSGIVIVNANIDKKSRNIINKPNIVTKGFIYVKENIDIIKEAENIVGEVIKENVKENYIDYNKIKLGIREKLGKYFYKETESKPMIIIVVQEV